MNGVLAPARSFLDARGNSWSVREILPRYAERRLRQRRLLSDSLAPGTAPEAPQSERDRRRRERRRRQEVRAPVTPGYERGWLTFESVDEKRRLAPVPPNWRRLPDAELRKLLALAIPTTRSWGRLTE